MNRKDKFREKIQSLVDDYFRRYRVAPHFECKEGYYVSEVTEEKEVLSS